MQPRSSCVSIHRFGLSPLTGLKKQKTKTVQRRTSPSPPRFLAPFALLSLDRGARRCGARPCRRLRAGILYLFLSSSCAAHGYRDHPRRRLREPICDGEPTITTTLGAREAPGQRRRLPSAHIFISAAIRLPNRWEIWRSTVNSVRPAGNLGRVEKLWEQSTHALTRRVPVRRLRASRTRALQARRGRDALTPNVGGWLRLGNGKGEARRQGGNG